MQGLIGGSGFYLADSKESLWPSRRLVVQDKKTGNEAPTTHLYTQECRYIPLLVSAKPL